MGWLTAASRDELRYSQTVDAEASRITGAVNRLVDEYRTRCLWSLRADYYPQAPDANSEFYPQFRALLTLKATAAPRNSVNGSYSIPTPRLSDSSEEPN